MPTNRTRFRHGRRDVMTAAQKAHLTCGCYFFDFRGEADHFVDEAHRRATWEAYRAQILEAWDHPGRRPDALWEYDFGLKCCPDPREWSWPRPIESEAEMVHRLLTEGTLEPCQFSGINPIASELEEIEASWLKEVELTIGFGDTLPKPPFPLETWGCPSWFWRKHARRIHAEKLAERAEYRAGLAQPLRG
jgi:hypothetical protein